MIVIEIGFIMRNNDDNKNNNDDDEDDDDDLVIGQYVFRLISVYFLIGQLIRTEVIRI